MNTIAIILTVLSAGALMGSAIAKIVGVKFAKEMFHHLGIPSKRLTIGILELAIAILYIIPFTNHIGFFLVCSYLGGAIVARLMKGDTIVPPTVLLALFWLAMYVKYPDIFF